MTLNYDILCSVELGHEYLGSQECDFFSWELAPGQDSARKIILCKSRGNKLSVLVPTDEDGASPASAVQAIGINGVSFFLNCLQPYLTNITDLPGTDRGHCHLFSYDSGQSALTLSPQPVQFVKTRVSLDSDSWTEGQVLQHCEEDTVVVGSPLGKEVVYDLKTSSDGLYTLQGDKPAYFFKWDQALMSPPFAVVHMAVQELAGMEQDRAMKLSFSSRRTTWQYILDAKLKDPEDTLSIEGNEPFESARPQEVNGRQMLVFQSQNEIPLTQKRERYFSLKSHSGLSGAERVLVKRLPLPSISVLNRHEGERWISPIFLNL